MQFDDIFAKYSSSPEQDYLTVSDTLRMLQGNRIVVDPFGWFAGVFEWGTLWYMVWCVGVWSRMIRSELTLPSGPRIRS